MENENISIDNNGDKINNNKSNYTSLTFNSKIKTETKMDPSNKATKLISDAPLGGGSTTNANNSPKMGSRRIFTPQFKLQVLESYRHDSDCKGNQRATARKYNIHRRQIQKWLQCESSLRSSVANISHNTVKHQFHNISVQQQQSHKLSLPSNSSIIGSYGSSQHSSHLSLDPTRKMMGTSLATSITAPAAQGVFTAASLAAVVAAAAVPGGANARANLSSSNTTTSPTNSVVSPLRPTAIIDTSRNTSATMSPLIQHHHYGIPPYTHAPAGVPLSVPILTHQISHPQHVQQQTQPPHQSYQYHNLAYTQTLTHQPDKQKSSYLSSVSHPTINALSTNSSSTTNGFASLDKNTYAECSNSTSVSDLNNYNEPFSIYQLKRDEYPLVYPLGPMDLSLRSRREIKTNVQPNAHFNKTSLNGATSTTNLTYRKRKVSNSSDVAYVFQNDFPEKQAKLLHVSGVEAFKSSAQNPTHVCFENVASTENCKEADDAEIEIEVGTEEKVPLLKPVKLFKPYLLDDYESKDAVVSSPKKIHENDLSESSETTPLTFSPTSTSPFQCYSDISVEPCRENTFHTAISDNFSTTHESSNFLAEIKTGSAFSPAISPPTLSPTIFQSPKSSPASSGYESSTSSYSESSLSSRSETYSYGQTYVINLQMHSIYNDNLLFHPSKHVEKWLDQEESIPSAPNSSIALFV